MSAVKTERYAEYKDSGVEWIGETPSHWLISRNKDIFFERGSLSQSGDETLLTVSHITGVTRRSEKNVNMFMAETMEGYKHCKKGDLVINTMWAWMGALGTANEDGICSPAYGVYAPRQFMPYSPRYFDYLYRTPNAISEMTRNSKGIVSSRLRLYPKDFFQILTALPPYQEQAAIAAYIDTKTSQIERQIDLLGQKATQYGKLKQSVINETVTRGLDKSVPLKNSGVEWIGEVPKHWQVKRVKELGDLVLGKMLDNTAESNKAYKPYLKSKNIGWLKLTGSNIEKMYFSPYETALYRIKSGDLLFSEGGEVGKTSIWNNEISECYIQNSVHKFTANKRNNSRYLLYLSFSAGQAKYYDSIVNFVSIKHLTKEKLARVEWLSPPLEEQTTIAAYLDEKTAQIDRIITAINTQIDKLKNLRTALINDVVTGKIKIVSEEDAA